MTGCCTPKTYGTVFDRRTAQWYARQYRRNGLDSTARQMVNFLKQRVQGRTVLEAGGGIGAIQLELLKAGAARATNFELSPAYEEVARDLLAEAGFADRVERRIMDFVEADGVEPADVVVMHRVVCCYPEMSNLVTAAARRARRYLALSFPRDAWWVRTGITIGNFFFRLRRSNFRTYVHPPDAILAAAASFGFHPALEDQGWLWRMAILEKQ